MFSGEASGSGPMMSITTASTSKKGNYFNRNVMIDACGEVTIDDGGTNTIEARKGYSQQVLAGSRLGQ